jgi:methanethiol S-methyltransferase
VRGRTFPGVREEDSHAAGRVVLVCTLWALIHSVLASRQAKDVARRVAGPRYRDGLYRVAYNVQAVASLVWAARWFSRLPDRQLYRARPPLSWLLRVGQAVSLGVLLSGVRVIGVMDFAGVTRLRGFLSGLDLGPEPEAQGPPINIAGEVVEDGAFRFTRHPGNLGAMGFFLLLPRMTTNRAVLTALVALYVVLGSMHEEYRLRAAYSAAYDRYRRSVPFLIPRPSRK